MQNYKLKIKYEISVYKNTILFILSMMFIVFMLGCQSTAIYTTENRTPSERNRVSGQRGRTEYMVSSWYGNPYHGRQTASGATFNMYDLTAAHRTLPFGTRLRLTNETNNKSVVVTINDRGPVPTDRDLDVSYRAAQALDFVDTGVIRLKVEFLN